MKIFSFHLESNQDGIRGPWDIGDPTETLACLTLLAALVGIILILGALCRRTCCPENVAGSYVSVMLEGGNIEETEEASGGVVTDPVTDAAAEWA